MGSRGDFQSLRGIPDCLPAAVLARRRIEQLACELLEGAGYAEIRLPLLEDSGLFQRSLGGGDDIVVKEMYRCVGGGGQHQERGGAAADGGACLRPEGTAPCVRAALQHGLLRGGGAKRRLWYSGAMFRHERPQRGRERQFHQIGAEAFGFCGPDVDAELIALGARLWRRLGIADRLSLHLNSLGDVADRQRYSAALADFLRGRASQLGADDRLRLERSPLRVLDSKEAATQALLAEAPPIDDYLGEVARAHFSQLRELLAAIGIDCTLDPRLVRGLDYYNRTVFEWRADGLGAQSAVAAGGRYDGLVEQLGGAPLPATGFALGVERLALLVADGPPPPQPDAYLVSVGGVESRAAQLAEMLRDALPGLRLVWHCGGGSFKSQLRSADRSGAALALLLGEEEAAQGQLTVKALRQPGAAQRTLPWSAVAELLRERMEGRAHG